MLHASLLRQRQICRSAEALRVLRQPFKQMRAFCPLAYDVCFDSDVPGVQAIVRGDPARERPLSRGRVC